MSDMPTYNPGPSAYQPVVAPKAPPVMNTVLYLLLGAALMSIVAAIFGAINAGSDETRASVQDQLVAQNVADITPDTIDAIVVFSMVTVIAVAVVSVIAYVLMGLFLKKGMGWARIVAVVLAVLSLTSLITLTMPGGIATLLQILLGIGAVILCFTGPGAAYFTEKKNFKLASKVS